MTALTVEGRSTIEMASPGGLPRLSIPMLDTYKVLPGSMVGLIGGYAVPASASCSCVAGVAQKEYDNSVAVIGHATGHISVECDQGIFKFGNSATTEALTIADVDTLCYVVDDQTVSRIKTAPSGVVRPVAGIVVQVDTAGVYDATSDGVWVKIAYDGGAAASDSAGELMLTAASFAAKQYYVGKLDSNGSVVVGTAGVPGIGIVQTATASAAMASVRKSGVSKAVLGGVVTAGDKLASDSAGKLVVAYGSDAVIAIALQSGILNDIVNVDVTAPAATVAQHTPSVINFHVNLANLANAGVVGGFTPGFAGRIKKISASVTLAASTGSKAASLQARIGSTATTGGVLALTSANMTPSGAVVEGSAISALNTFSATDTVSLLISGVTTFIEGEAELLITLA